MADAVSPSLACEAARLYITRGLPGIKRLQFQKHRFQPAVIIRLDGFARPAQIGPRQAEQQCMSMENQLRSYDGYG